jgi:hypothetical protein
MHDHELNIAGTVYRLNLVRDQNEAPMFQVMPQVPKYLDGVLFRQSDWSGGHGQHTFERFEDMYFEGSSIDTTQDGRVILAPLIRTIDEDDDSDLDSGVLGFCYFPTASLFLCWTTNKIYHLDSFVYSTGAGGWDLATTTVGGVTDIKIYNGVAYAACGASTLYKYSTDGLTWTTTDLTDGYANFFLVSPNPDGTQDVLWKCKTPNELSYTTNGKTVAQGGSQWSTPAYIGDTTNNITNVFLVNNNLMIGKADGLFHYASDGGVHPLLDELKINRTSQNFKYVTSYKSSVYFSMLHNLGEISTYNSYRPMGALYNIDDIGKDASSGIPLGLASDGEWLYMAVGESSNNIIYKGRESNKYDIGGNSKKMWEWCPIVTVASTDITLPYVYQVTSQVKVLFFRYALQTGYIVLSDNPTSDSNARFTPSGWVRMSYTYGSNPFWDKMVQSTVTETKGCMGLTGTIANGSGIVTGSTLTLNAGTNTPTITQAGTFTVVVPTGSAGTAATGGWTVATSPVTLVEGSNTITVSAGGSGTITITLNSLTVQPYYRKDTDTSATALTAAITGNGVTRTHLTTALSCNRIQLQANLTTNDSTKTPELLFMEARGVEKPEEIRVYECVYHAGDRPDMTAKTLVDALRTARTSTTMIKFAQLPYNESVASTNYKWVVVEPGYPQEIPISHPKEKNVEWAVKCRFREVTYTLS